MRDGDVSAVPESEDAARALLRTGVGSSAATLRRNLQMQLGETAIRSHGNDSPCRRSHELQQGDPH